MALPEDLLSLLSFGLGDPEETLAQTLYNLDTPDDEEDEMLSEEEMREKVEIELRARAKATAEAVQAYIEAKLTQYGLERSE